MTNYFDLPTDMSNTSFEFQALSFQAIALEPHHFEQAQKISDRIITQERQWQTYLNALALFSFEQWLDETATDLMGQHEFCSILQPHYANEIEAVCNFKVGEFKVCLMAMGSVDKPTIKLPQAAVDLSEFAAHFYVIVRVLEEEGWAEVWGFLRRDQLIDHQQSNHLQAAKDWAYRVPTSWFDRDTNRLLLHLRCLELGAIALPKSTLDRSSILTQMQNKLEQLLPQLRSPETELWQVLSWEQGAALLTSPSLLEWLYQLRTEEAQTPSLDRRLNEILQLLTQPAVNVGHWLRGELDEIAQKLAWVLLPPFAPMRSPVEAIGHLLAQLQQVGMRVPPQARGVFKDISQDFYFAGVPLGLYAVTWSQLSAQSVPEWTLLLALATSSGQPLPPGIQLRVSDETHLLVEQKPKQQKDSYLYVRVTGTWDEKFLASIELNDTIFQLPPFSFQLN